MKQSSSRTRSKNAGKQPSVRAIAKIAEMYPFFDPLPKRTKDQKQAVFAFYRQLLAYFRAEQPSEEKRRLKTLFRLARPYTGWRDTGIRMAHAHFEAALTDSSEFGEVARQAFVDLVDQAHQNDVAKVLNGLTHNPTTGRRVLCAAFTYGERIEFGETRGSDYWKLVIVTNAGSSVAAHVKPMTSVH